MRYFNINSVVTLIADAVTWDDNRYTYTWIINIDRQNTTTLTGYTITTTFNNLGVKALQLNVTDKSTGLVSTYYDSLYIIPAGLFIPATYGGPIFVQPIPNMYFNNFIGDTVDKNNIYYVNRFTEKIMINDYLGANLRTACDYSSLNIFIKKIAVSPNKIYILSTLGNVFVYNKSLGTFTVITTNITYNSIAYTSYIDIECQLLADECVGIVSNTVGALFEVETGAFLVDPAIVSPTNGFSSIYTGLTKTGTNEIYFSYINKNNICCVFIYPYSVIAIMDVGAGFHGASWWADPVSSGGLTTYYIHAVTVVSGIRKITTYQFTGSTSVLSPIVASSYAGTVDDISATFPISISTTYPLNSFFGPYNSLTGCTTTPSPMYTQTLVNNYIGV